MSWRCDMFTPPSADARRTAAQGPPHDADDLVDGDPCVAVGVASEGGLAERQRLRVEGDVHRRRSAVVPRLRGAEPSVNARGKERWTSDSKTPPSCVQGGTKGLGRAAAECFAADRARVVVLARGQDGIDQTVAALARLGSPDAFGIRDRPRRPGVDRRRVRRGRPSAGASSTPSSTRPVPAPAQQGFADIADEEWRRAYEIGALSAVRCTRAALPLLRKARVGAHRERLGALHQAAVRALVAYTAAKAAMTSISKNLSLVARARGILVNTVSPGSFLRGMVGCLGAAPERGSTPTLDDRMRGDRRGLRPSGAPAARRRPARDRPGHRVRRLAGEQLHDRRGHQRRRRLGLLLSPAEDPEDHRRRQRRSVRWKVDPAAHWSGGQRLAKAGRASRRSRYALRLGTRCPACRTSARRRRCIPS